MSDDLVAAGFELGYDGWKQDYHGVYFALNESPGASGPVFRELEV